MVMILSSFQLRMVVEKMMTSDVGGEDGAGAGENENTALIVERNCNNQVFLFFCFCCLSLWGRRKNKKL